MPSTPKRELNFTQEMVSQHDIDDSSDEEMGVATTMSDNDDEEKTVIGDTQASSTSIILSPRPKSSPILYALSKNYKNVLQTINHPSIIVLLPTKEN